MAIENDTVWHNSDDFYLLEGINKYGLEEWEKIASDIELWDLSKTKVLNQEQVWKTLFKKIEDQEPPENQEHECYQ